MSKLLSFRKDIGWTQQEMAKKIGISVSYYAMIELELRNPSYNFMMKFIEAFPDCGTSIFFLNKKFTNREV